MKHGKKFLAAILTLVLCLSVLVPTPVQAADAFFTAVDDTVMKLTNENMPIWSGGVLYAPYTTFNESDNGVRNWDIQVSYSKTGNRVTVFDTRRFLEFDLKTGTCWDDLTGIAYSGGAIVRGGRPYLPVEIVCEHFGMTYSYREIEQGSLLRIKTDDVVIPDSRFAEAADNVLNLRLREYNQSQPGNGAASNPGTSQQPGQPLQPENEQSVKTYLAFRCKDAEHLDTVLAVMDGIREKGMFFLTRELIETRGDLVLRILGSGNSVGLLAEAGTIEETRELLDGGSRALAEQVFARTTVVLAGQDFHAQLEEEGWVCWNSTLDMTPGSTVGANYFASRMLSRLGSRTRDTYLTMDVGADTVRVLLVLLRRLDEEGFRLELPLETKI